MNKKITLYVLGFYVVGFLLIRYWYVLADYLVEVTTTPANMMGKQQLYKTMLFTLYSSGLLVLIIEVFRRPTGSYVKVAVILLGVIWGLYMLLHAVAVGPM